MKKFDSKVFYDHNQYSFEEDNYFEDCKIIQTASFKNAFYSDKRFTFNTLNSVEIYAFDTAQFKDLQINNCSAIHPYAFNQVQSVHLKVFNTDSLLKCALNDCNLSILDLNMINNIESSAIISSTIRDLYITNVSTIQEKILAGSTIHDKLWINKFDDICSDAFKNLSVPIVHIFDGQEIEQNAFSNCTDISNITLMSIDNLQDGNFNNLSLAEVFLDTIEHIGNSFCDCIIKKLHIANCDCIDSNAFQNTTIEDLDFTGTLEQYNDIFKKSDIYVKNVHFTSLTNGDNIEDIIKSGMSLKQMNEMVLIKEEER